MMQEKEVPAYLSKTPEQVDALRAALVQMFAQFPPEEPEDYPASAMRAEQCRRVAMDNLGIGPDPRRAAFMALDTGIPNELVLATYMLIFETKPT